MRLIFLTPSLIGSIYGGIYHLTNRQVVLMGLRLMTKVTLLESLNAPLKANGGTEMKRETNVIM